MCLEANGCQFCEIQAGVASQWWSPGQWVGRIKKENLLYFPTTPHQASLAHQMTWSHYSLTYFQAIGNVCSALPFGNRAFLISTHWLSVHINQSQYICKYNHPLWLGLFPHDGRLSINHAQSVSLNLGIFPVLPKPLSCTGHSLSFHIRSHFMVSKGTTLFRKIV